MIQQSGIRILGLPGLYQNWLLSALDTSAVSVPDKDHNFVTRTHSLTWIKKIDAEVLPELSQSLKNINSITATESPLQLDIRDSLREIAKAANSVRVLTDMLEQQPQSLIFGKPSEGLK